MLRAIVWILISLFFAGAGTGCALFQQSKDERLSEGPALNIFKFEFDKVWRAAQKAVAKYPIKTNNIEIGLIETDIIRGDKGFKPAHMNAKLQPGLRYQIIVKLVRGQTVDGQASTEVTVEKRISLEKNFFAEGKKVASDGLEEDALMYRIDRELTIERALDRSYENQAN